MCGSNFYETDVKWPLGHQICFFTGRQLVRRQMWTNLLWRLWKCWTFTAFKGSWFTFDTWWVDDQQHKQIWCQASTWQALNVNHPPFKAVKMLNFHAFLGPTQVSCLAERSWESGATFFNYINSVETNGITGKIRFEVRKNSIILQIIYFQKISFFLQKDY